MKKVKSKSIRLYNVFVEEGEYKLTVEELYLYSVLRRLVNYESQTFISMSGIEQYSRNYNSIKFYGKLQESQKRVKDNLFSLVDKGVISVDVKAKKYDQFFKVTFTEKLGGYEYIPFDKFDSVKGMIHNYIHFVVAKWMGTIDGTFNCSYNRWSEILDVTPKTAEKYLDECVKEELIYCNVADYTNDLSRPGQKKRGVNQYKLTPFTDEEKSNMQRKLESDTKTPEQSQDGENEVLDTDIDPFGNVSGDGVSDEWGQSESDIHKAIKSFKTYGEHFPNEYDYKQYLLIKDNPDTNEKKELVKVAKKRMKAMKQYYVRQGLSEAEKLISKDKAEKQAEIDEENKHRTINAIKNGQIAVVRNDEDVYIDSIDDIRVNDKLYRVYTMGDPLEGEENDHLNSFSIEDIIKEQSNNADLYHTYSDNVIEQLLDKFKQVYAAMPKSPRDTFDVYNVGQKVKEYRDELSQSINSQRSYDEFHEGDVLHWDDDRNVSLINRINDMEKSKKAI